MVRLACALTYIFFLLLLLHRGGVARSPVPRLRCTSWSGSGLSDLKRGWLARLLCEFSVQICLPQEKRLHPHRSARHVVPRGFRRPGVASSGGGVAAVAPQCAYEGAGVWARPLFQRTKLQQRPPGFAAATPLGGCSGRPATYSGAPLPRWKPRTECKALWRPVPALPGVGRGKRLGRARTTPRGLSGDARLAWANGGDTPAAQRRRSHGDGAAAPGDHRTGTFAASND